MQEKTKRKSFSSFLPSVPRCLGAFVPLILLIAASSAHAMPTQEEVFRSISDHVGSTVDMRKFFIWTSFIGLAIITIAFIHNRKTRPKIIRKIHQPSSLLREVCKALDLKSAELKQLKLLAEIQGVKSPLTLLLCPTVLAKAMREAGSRVDRQVLQGLLQQIREGLVSSKSSTPS